MLALALAAPTGFPEHAGANPNRYDSQRAQGPQAKLADGEGYRRSVMCGCCCLMARSNDSGSALASCSTSVPEGVGRDCRSVDGEVGHPTRGTAHWMNCAHQLAVRSARRAPRASSSRADSPRIAGLPKGRDRIHRASFSILFAAGNAYLPVSSAATNRLWTSAIGQIAPIGWLTPTKNRSCRSGCMVP